MFSITRDGKAYALTDQELEYAYRMVRRQRLMAKAEAAFDGYAGYHNENSRLRLYRDENGSVPRDLLSDIVAQFETNHEPNPDEDQWQDSVAEALSGYAIPGAVGSAAHG